VIQEGGGGDIVFYGAAEIARFANGGGLGINTTSPDGTLHVEGDTFLGDKEGNGDFVEVTAAGLVHFAGGGGLLFGEMSAEGNAVESAIAVAGTAVQVLIFDTNGLSSGNTTPDHTNDHILTGVDGIFEINVAATINSVAGAASKCELQCQKNNGASEILVHADTNYSGGGGEAHVMFLHGYADLVSTDTVEVWIVNETNTANYVVEDIVLTIKQIAG
ncbi:unnamed protein product, partial [marine sediment metagenome]